MNSLKHNLLLLITSVALLTFGCAKENKDSYNTANKTYDLYSKEGREHHVRFEALYLTSAHQINELRQESLISEIEQTLQFLSGPLTERSLAGIQKGEIIEPRIKNAFIKDGQVMVPYTYKGVWLIRSEVLAASDLTIPIPFSTQILRTENWKRCTDSSPDHSTWDFFWYFWDPARTGCDHQVDVQYQEVHIAIGTETIPTALSYPEYKNLIHEINGKPTLAMTFAFGYVEDVRSPNPFKDQDEGMQEFQKFYSKVKKQLVPLGFKETFIQRNENAAGEKPIGSRFNGQKDGTEIQVIVIAAASVDQMDLFADSYAKKHEGFFGWFGHSRVGGGFDADRFQQNLTRNPTLLSLSPDYQLIYWAGCNSYSYYTLPFFKLKSEINPSLDPNGTKKLDLISNGLPSLFSFNAFNANVLFQALINWENPVSYQVIVDQIENHAKSFGFPVIVNVLGDEDNLK